MNGMRILFGLFALTAATALCLTQTADARGDDAKPAVEKKYRSDKTLLSEIIKNADGSTITREYRKDGITLEREQIENADGSGSLTYFEDDGKTPSEKAVWSGANSKPKRSYFKKGVLSWTRREIPMRSAALEFKKVYRNDGTASHEQILYPTWNFLFDEILGGMKVGVVIEYHKTPPGKTERMKRRIVLRQDGSGNPETVYEYNAKGTFCAARYYRPDGTLEKEELFDGPGNHKGTKTYTAKDNKREPAFDDLMKDPYFD